MIRFVDLREQDTGFNFAFFNTVTDKFLEFEGEQVWDSIEEFRFVASREIILGRCLNLIPDWVPREASH